MIMIDNDNDNVADFWLKSKKHTVSSIIVDISCKRSYLYVDVSVVNHRDGNNISLKQLQRHC